MFADAIRLALGDQHSMLLDRDGSVWSAGVTCSGVRERFVQVIPSGVATAAACNSHSMVMKQDGSVWAVGENSKVQLGNETKTTGAHFSWCKG